MESTLESSDGRESIGFAVESAQQGQFGLWWSTSCLFFNEGGPLSAPSRFPKADSA